MPPAARSYIAKMRQKFIIKPVEKGFVLSKEGELWQRSFTSLQEALRHASGQPNTEGAKVVVLSERGTLELDL